MSICQIFNSVTHSLFNSCLVTLGHQKNLLHLFGCPGDPEVTVLSDEVTRDDIRQNKDVLTVAANLLGLRVGVKTCQVHVKALYELMQIPCPGNLQC